MKPTRIAVIIPYFQRRPGLLAAAVASIAAQELGAGVEVEVIIVDDGSPSPAAAEEFPTLPDWCRIRIVKQDNRGISAARNAGLDAVGTDTDYVAFLDSDDIWAPRHLAMAIEAFENAADIYFDNSYFDAGESYFEKLNFIQKYHPAIDVDKPETYYMDGRQFYLASLLETVAHTSQTVFRFANCPSLRFEEGLKTSGEDRLYFAEMARSACRVGYHSGIMGSRGRGVSVYRSRLGWDVAALERTVDEIKCRSLIIDRLDPPQEEKQEIERARQFFSDHFVFLAVRNLTSSPAEVARIFGALVTWRPSFVLSVPGSCLRLSGHRRKLLEAEAVRVGQPATLP
jgi:succinoglycan biosynthesis protein ExoW